jgi:hypothetical protein
MPRKLNDHIVKERTARLRALRVAAVASRELDRELVERAGAPTRPQRPTRRGFTRSIRVEDLNAANDK